MTQARHICLITSTRADWSHLRWAARAIEAEPGLRLSVLATGTHLSARFGHTEKEIEADGFTIAERVDMLVAGDSSLSVAKSSGLAVIGIAEALQRLAPDVVLVLGDRYEILAAVQAALIMGVPVAHLHGGETSEGAMDEQLRHAITKMSHLHFAAAPPYAERIRQMGENPARVFLVGAPGLDSVEHVAPVDRKTLGDSLHMDLDRPFLIVTYHPVTLQDSDPALAVVALTGALDRFPDHKVILTGVNADAGHDRVRDAFSAWVIGHRDRVVAVESLGQSRYLNAVRLADAVVGNSSSGLIEAPAVGTPTVNIGERQAGRLKAASVIDCAETTDAIADAITRAIDPAFRQAAAQQTPPYGRGGAGAKIAEILATTRLDGIRRKHFFDLAAPQDPA